MPSEFLCQFELTDRRSSDPRPIAYLTLLIEAPATSVKLRACVTLPGFVQNPGCWNLTKVTPATVPPRLSWRQRLSQRLNWLAAKIAQR